MDFITGLIDLLLHIDKTMLQFVEAHGIWIYALLVAIIFADACNRIGSTHSCTIAFRSCADW
jgi:hypothetical protein